ncbi:hypothetical protein E1293_10900 [Actinomadura darangshiensis]|uniref:Uncharacterized protein n=1 Tax=Actinomadura darangshiensis TaxID=705336 RepID=A0A4R5BK95_9ACTN|nr:hypothetical protein [Actinomadura darangshiensis]TDD85606.1 hypothetical protein E1293_10900 [Actinomadura darangshiensis]
MGFTFVHSQAGVPPSRVEDLASGDGTAVDRHPLVVAGQALTWQTTFTSGSATAVPVSGASAVVFNHDDGTGQGRWNRRFARGFAHRMAGELTIASVTVGLLDETAGAEADEDAEMLGSAVDGLARLLTDLEDSQAPEESADRIVADALSTHAALMGPLIEQRVTVRQRDEFTVHTVRSVSADLRGPALERLRARVGLPWPARVENGVGVDLGLARWCTTMQVNGHQMWSRLEEGTALVTDLWLRSPPEPRE